MEIGKVDILKSLKKEYRYYYGKIKAVDVIEGWLRILKDKDICTYNHSCNVCYYTIAIAKEMEFSEEKLENLASAALLHDIGKIYIPDSILKKKGRLMEAEYRLIKEHSKIGSEILSGNERFKAIEGIVKYHHEYYDGLGYPEGLSGDNIPIGARILSIIDAFDTITSDRCYKKAQSIDKGINELIRCSGTQFDPEIVEVFLKVLRNLIAIVKKEQLNINYDESQIELYMKIKEKKRRLSEEVKDRSDLLTDKIMKLSIEIDDMIVKYNHKRNEQAE
ncbi:HD-GYP domain-containing protein [Halonatronum saccharophilum]|uniref:HD-GYP domain-containing protein n=1 Tax=Halonatronum saccharophilum TaxID=150060 RepID=UPI0004AEEC02|nr:HD-GYP domain-containing protein [Halonatronum saccharophilum]